MNPTTEQKTLLLINAGSESKRFIPPLLKELGITLLCLHNEVVPALQGSVDGWIEADPTNVELGLVALEHYLTSHPDVHIDGAVTYWDESVLLTSKIVDELGLTGISYSTALRIRNKHSFRALCTTLHLATPRHAPLHSLADIDGIENNLHYPMVIKPAHGSCSAYVTRVNNRHEFIQAYHFITKNIGSFWLADQWGGIDLFVEEYIDGKEVDIDILLQNGDVKFCTISDNFRKDTGSFFMDSGQAVPSILPANTQQALHTMATETLARLGITDGCIHFEAKASSHGPRPLEINLRMGGDYIYHYLHSAWGIDMVQEAARIALGDTVQFVQPEKPVRHVIGWDIQPPVSGTLTSLTVDPALETLPYLEKLYFHKQVGEEVLRPPEGYDAIGWFTVNGATREAATVNLHEALRYITFTVATSNQPNVVHTLTEAAKHMAASSPIPEQMAVSSVRIDQWD